MGVAHVVAELAEAIAAKVPLTAHQALLVYLLRAMPLYVAVARLDAWESVILEAVTLREPEQVPVTGLIDSVFEFGRHNLYTAFDVAGTRREFAILSSHFAMAGLPVPQSPDLSDW